MRLADRLVLLLLATSGVPWAHAEARTMPGAFGVADQPADHGQTGLALGDSGAEQELRLAQFDNDCPGPGCPGRRIRPGMPNIKDGPGSRGVGSHGGGGGGGGGAY